MDNLYQSDICLNFIISFSENAILFALAKVQIEHVPCPKLDWTLERCVQCAGLNACEMAATLPEILYAAEIRSKLSTDDLMTTEICMHVGLRQVKTAFANTHPRA
jgi:hypothetical protein